MMLPKPPPRPPDDPRNVTIALRKELVCLGFDDRAIAALVKAGELEKIRRGAYTDGGQYRTLDRAGRYGALTRAVLKQAKTAVVASHVSSVPEYDGPLWGFDLTCCHVTRIDGRTGRREAGVQQHCGSLIEGDVVERNGILVTSATRSALEVTMAASQEASLAYVNHLLNRGFTTQEMLAKRYASMGTWPHSLGTDIVLGLANPRIESLGESRTYWVCFRHGVPMPQPQYEVRDSRGNLVARLDFAWPEYGVFLEFDGKVKYEKLLRPGERVSDVVLREKAREELVCRLTGWRCLRITWADLEHPERTAAMILSFLAAAAA